MTSGTQQLPSFTYFQDPVGNGCIVQKQDTCPCCSEQRSHMYVGPIYTTADVEMACPWCIADGTAAAKWSARFNDVDNAPPGVSKQTVLEIETRTPGYSSWQGNIWLFSQTDAMVFLGEVHGGELLQEGNAEKVEACLKALRDWNLDWPAEDLKRVLPGDQPAIYLFQDRTTAAFDAYADMT